MRRSRIVVAAALAASTLSAPIVASADPQPVINRQMTSAASADELARLQAADRRLAGEAYTTKGAPQQRILLEKQRIDRLINALKTGQRVDPNEIDKAIEEANRVP